MNTKNLYIGLMSGTSADGIDLALVDFSESTPRLLASFYQAYTQTTHKKIIDLYTPSDNEIDRAFSLDIELAQQFATAIICFLKQQKLTASDISAIGNHGQTIRHRPKLSTTLPAFPFTLQIGCNQTLATLTNIKVIGQFRRKDMALGGQGAPLVPVFHQAMFAQASENVFVINIGGIANITFLPATQQSTIPASTLLGYDTGPGNALLDDWFYCHNNNNNNKNQPRFDENGHWAASGKKNTMLLTQLLTDLYFKLPAPKSTGREYFNLAWLQKYLALPNIIELKLTNADIQATLSSLTAQTIANEVKKLSKHGKIYLCGGGVHNFHLKNQLIQQLKNYEILLTNHNDIDTDSLEAMAFAWLAFAYNKKFFSNIPAVTGACRKATLGCAFYP